MSDKLDPQAALHGKPALNRRNFLKLLGLAGASAWLTGCRAPYLPQSPSSPVERPTSTLSVPSLAPSATPTAEPTATPAPSPTPALPYTVSIAQANSYDPAVLQPVLFELFDNLPGLRELIKPGVRIAIKANLTGGTWWDTPDKPPATEFFVTHPAVVGALCAWLREAGAERLVVVDGLGDETSFSAWGYREMAALQGVELVDLCKPDPSPGYYRFLVPGEPLAYEFFYMNGVIREVDLLFSVAKMKCHTTTGVTLSMKNLFGMVPISEYRYSPAENNRSAFHESTVFDTRVPKVIMDLNRAAPITFSLIDGIFTAEAGAGPWDTAMSQVKPGLLVAGLNPVATDAVAAALMGFDPTAEAGASPFVGSDNHLNLAREMGLGSNRLEEIGILGPSIEALRFPFKPAR
jgi:uncharacterized protein (DUF362 family)